MKLYFLLILIINSNTIVQASYSNEVKQLQSKLQDYDLKLKNKRDELKILEEKLLIQNKNIMSNITSKQKIQEVLQSQTNQLQLAESELVLIINNIQDVIDGLVLSYMANDLGNNLAEEDAFKIILSEKIEGLKLQIQEGQNQKTTIEDLKKKLNILIEKENSLLTDVRELEEKKNSSASDYLTIFSEKEREYEKLEELLGRLKAKNESKKVARLDTGKFRTPVDSFLSVKKNDTNLTFKLKAGQNLIAVGNGIVEYAGELSKFGKVIIIDHGSDIRTIYLGSLKPVLERGKAVQAGIVVGVTENDGNMASLYFEIRKKDAVQKISHYINLQSQSKLYAQSQ